MTLTVFMVLAVIVIFNGDNWWHLYSTVRGEILGFVEDRQMRKYLPRLFSLIKNKS